MTALDAFVAHALAPIRSVRGAVAMALMAGVGALAAVLPLTRVLGYESSALVGMLVPLACGVLWFDRRSLDDRAGGPARAWLRLAHGGAWLLLPPLAILLLNALRVPNCSLGTGLEFYLLIAGGSVGYTALVGTCAVFLTSRPGRAWAWLLGVLLTSIAASAAWLALEPPVVAYHPFFGYFAGSIYDEGLDVPAGLWIVRAYHAAFVTSALVVLDQAWASRVGQGRAVGLRVLGVASALAALLIFAHRAELGLAVDRERLTSELSEVVQTEHFVLHLTPGSWQADKADLVADDFEFRYAQLERFFGQQPVGPGEHIHVYVYADPVQKGALMGARRTMVAKLWLREVHLVYPELGYDAVEHELAHVFSAPFGRGPLSLSVQAGVIPNMGVVEGLAEAPVGRRAELTLHEWSAAMRRLELAPDLRDLVGARGFWGTTSAAAYTLMGSFMAWLAETRGRDKLLAAYGDADFEGVYGESIDALVGQWERWVDALPLHDDVLPLARYYFERPTLFDQRCARFVGALRLSAADALTARRMDQARACYERIVAIQPDNLDARLEYAQVLAMSDQPDEAREQLEAILITQGLSRVHQARARLLLGDLILDSDPDKAQRIYRDTSSAELPLHLRRSLAARILLIQNGFHGIGEYLELGRSPLLRAHRLERWRDLDPDVPVVNYLLGRELFADHDFAEAIPLLTAATTTTEPLPWPIQAEALQTLAICHVALGRLDDAQEALQALIALDLPGGVRAEAHDWLERVAWMRGR